MKLALLAVTLGVLGATANPVRAQFARRVAVEPGSFDVPAVLDEPFHELKTVGPKSVEPKAIEALAPAAALTFPAVTLVPALPAPAKPVPWKIAPAKPALRTRTADRLFWLHSSAFAGSIALDAWSTSRLVNFYNKYKNSPIEVPGICTEGNRSLGPAPSDGRIAGYFLAWTSGEVAATYLLKRVTRHFKPRWARESWRAPISYFTVYHAFWGLHNLNNCR